MPTDPAVEALAEVIHGACGCTTDLPECWIGPDANDAAAAALDHIAAHLHDDTPEGAALRERLGVPKAFERWQYGITRPAMPHVGTPERIEWGASVGMSHRYDYTAENVHALANGRATWRRRHTTYPDVYGEPERFDR